MKIYEKELTPVIYNMAAVKIIKSSIKSDSPLCFRMHWHERMEILRIREGQIDINFGTYSHVFSGGEIVIIHPNQLHMGVLVGEEVKYDTFMFDVRSFYNDTDICKKYLPPIFDGRTRFNQSTSDPDIVNCIDSAIEFAQSEINSLHVTARIYELFALLYERCLLVYPQTSKSDTGVQRITDYMEKNFAQDLSTESLSQIFKYSKPYFCRKFKESTGLTPMNYLKIFRVEKAYRLFKDGETDISSVALKCGFTDSNYFTRCFKSHFGHPPTYYTFKK